MKKIYSLFFAGILIISGNANAQSNIFVVDGETPNPLLDRTGNHNVNITGAPVDSAGFLVFKNEVPLQIHNYLGVDNMIAVFDVNQDWTVEFKFYTNSPQDPHYFLDWGSSTSTGHMRFAFDEDKGIHFSDRPVNGQTGAIIADSLPLIPNTWMAIKFVKSGSNYFLYRNGILVKTSANTASLTTPTVLTVAYSQDDRPFHNWYLMDDVKISTGIVNGISKIESTKSEVNFWNSLIQIKNNSDLLSTIEIYNLCGQLVATNNVNANSSKQISLNNESGIYFVKFTNSNESLCKKIVVR
jgi:hypothetical protein